MRLKLSISNNLVKKAFAMAKRSRDKHMPTHVTSELQQIRKSAEFSGREESDTSVAVVTASSFVANNAHIVVSPTELAITI